MPWLIPHSSSILLRPGCSCHFCSKTVHCSSMNDCGKREKPYFWKILVCYLAYNSPIVGEWQARVAEVLTLLLDRVCQDNSKDTLKLMRDFQVPLNIRCGGRRGGIICMNLISWLGQNLGRSELGSHYRLKSCVPSLAKYKAIFNSNLSTSLWT